MFGMGQIDIKTLSAEDAKGLIEKAVSLARVTGKPVAVALDDGTPVTRAGEPIVMSPMPVFVEKKSKTLLYILSGFIAIGILAFVGRK